MAIADMAIADDHPPPAASTSDSNDTTIKPDNDVEAKDVLSDAPDAPAADHPPDAPKVPSFQRGPRFWAIIATLCVIGLLSSLENTVVTTSLPAIAALLDLGENYIWVTNVFFLTSAAVQPLFGQLANLFGRRWVTLAIIALFALGSGLAGGARNAATLIAGRAVQGMGSGGINMIVDIIVSDLVPLRERGNYMSMVLSVYFVGLALGPYVGGALVQHGASWRWVFYINLPVCGAAMLMILLFLKVKPGRASSSDGDDAVGDTHADHADRMWLLHRLGRIDYLGNLLLIASTVAVLYALTYGGTRLPWSSAQIVGPLVAGLVGLALFMLYEASATLWPAFPLAPREAVVPPRLFANRTSATIFAVTFINAALLYWLFFFLPVYFQAVLGSSPTRSGVQLLPAIVIGVPAAIAAVLLLTRYGRYKPLHLFGFGVNTVGLGLLTLLDQDSSTAAWVLFQVVVAAGSGFVLNTLLPGCQAPLSEADQAAATAAWSFMRSFGSVWGVAIPAAIFSNYFDRLAARPVAQGGISDPAVAAQFRNGRSYEAATAATIQAIPEPVRSEVVGVYVAALKYVWRFSIILGGVSFFLVFFEKQVKMRTELETEYGLDDGKDKKNEKAKKADVELADVAKNGVLDG
ncbi:hypothetical protein HMPREF1624_08295 [Sporothrix schenckii ATCC 58251]|uniref:Major facilitator superfamily (MFS) profile domain-containing protein n=1 Tax=Sporothrix schenckii (strain ATCC 58251 / de Perez 2211183) TaxID=1391915 RepID=U7PIS2_SPOS1|nr:hypothetical protein HMPREF1624_08295 [Sporothrix schenckii ATCC 58251]